MLRTGSAAEGGKGKDSPRLCPITQRVQPWPRDCDLQEQGSQDTAELVQGVSSVCHRLLCVH